MFPTIGLWNTPGPAPEYRLGWGDKALVRQCMLILDWNFERVILSHGDLIARDAKRVVAHAWRKVLGREAYTTGSNETRIRRASSLPRSNPAPFDSSDVAPRTIDAGAPR